MSDVTRPPGDGTSADRGQTTPDARGETALGTGTGSTPGTADPAVGNVRGAGETSAADDGTAGSPARDGRRDGQGSTGAQLLPHEECDQLAARLQHAVAEFVDRPRDAVEEADHALEEIASRFTDAVTQRRRTLRRSWQSADAGGGKPTTSTDTEQLRLALRDYRELAERLLRV
ncbi:hypothetical protein [Streptomyces bullii]|uniref:Uncharacterized protein n=1 Tax=Streptomyces bullii TaxID=349910 RepID=A0ABW0UGG0_9ACTN